MTVRADVVLVRAYNDRRRRPSGTLREVFMKTWFLISRNKAIIGTFLLSLCAVIAGAAVIDDFREAVKRGDLTAVKGFLGQGVNVNSKLDKGGRTALILASERG